jgi:hypothetical protein
MTQPVQEPSPQRTDASLTFGARQLRRRPGPPAGGEIPWARRSKGFDAGNQTIGTGTLTAVTFNHNYNMGAGESGEAYFGPVSDSIEILQDGFYLITGEVIWTTSPNWTGAIGYYDSDAIEDHLFGAAAPNSGGFNTQAFTAIHRYTAASIFITLTVMQNSGSTKDIDAAYLEISYLGSWTGTDFLSMDPAQ